MKHEAEVSAPVELMSGEDLARLSGEVSEQRRWDVLGDEQPNIVREALIQADQLRSVGLDGDSFLQGAAWHHTVVTEPDRRSRFEASMQGELGDTRQRFGFLRLHATFLTRLALKRL